MDSFIVGAPAQSSNGLIEYDRASGLHFGTMLWTAAVLALGSLRAHKLRTFLTLLGVILGVGSVVLVGAAIEGVSTFAEQTTAKTFGSNGFQVGQLLQMGRLSRREVMDLLKYNRQIRPEDYQYLLQTAGDRIWFSPYRQRADDVKYESETLEGVTILGTAAVLSEIRDVALSEGRYFSEQEERNRTSVAVIGEELRRKFMAGVSPLGRTIRISGREFTIIGVQEKIGNLGPGANQDLAVYIPYPLFLRLYGNEKSLLIFGRPKPASGLNVDQAVDLVRVALRSRFKTRPGKPDNFDTMTPEAAMEFINRILGLVGAAIVPITCISLVVGGIVIMNIMLVSVTERTREIGVRKSLGARHRDLMLQFLLEATMLSLLGGGIGLGGAWVIAKLATTFSGITLTVTWPYVVLAVVVSTLVGVLSGWYPARRAAMMDPVEALRSE